jgi:paraquat-inducible protein B
VSNERSADERRSSDVGRTKAEVRRGWWPGWIWAIPIAVILMIGWWVVRSLTSGGAEITISFDNVHGLKPSDDTKLVYRGMKVGEVRGVELAEDGKSVEVSVEVDKKATQFLKAGTEFWLRGAAPSLSDLGSLSAVLAGPSLVMEPGPGEKAKHFIGHVGKPIVSGAAAPPQIYAVSLQGSVGGLKEGAPVKLRGFAVGEVREVGFHYNADTGELSTPVTLALYPSLFHIEGTAAPEPKAALTAAIDRLVGEGLRARLERDPPLIGDPQVTLDIVPGAGGGAPKVAAGGVPQIPAAPGGGGIDSIVERVNKLPLDEIANNILDTTQHVDRLVSSPELAGAISELNGTLKQVHETAANVGPDIAQLVERLRKTAGKLDEAVAATEQAAKSAQAAARSANQVLGGTPSQHGMDAAMREITEAARSVRELANYLDRHPEALIKGR